MSTDAIHDAAALGLYFDKLPPITSQPDAVLFERAKAFGRMESGVRSAIWQLEHGNADLALASLRSALK